MHSIPSRSSAKASSRQRGSSSTKKATSTAEEVEELGVDTLWINDHLLPRVGPPEAPNLEGWTMLGAIAALTARVRIGVIIVGQNY
jgi:alkanesulfonate monooxygenase SsuD/methylene tetrahydromethanopterin reductase-like flavin-dependent oxidoreductase (luciferase family)